MRAPSLKVHSKADKRARPEASLQKAIVQIVMLSALPGVLWFAIRNEARRSLREGYEAKRMGLRPGAADMCFVVNGRAHFMELKADKGKQSPEQVAFAADCVIASAPYEVVKDIDHAQQVLRGWGVLRGHERMRRAA